MILQEFSQLRLGNTVMRCLQRPPNFFAADVRSGIVATGLMTDEVLQARLFPRFRGFALLHRVTVEKDRRKAEASFSPGFESPHPFRS